MKQRGRCEHCHSQIPRKQPHQSGIELTIYPASTQIQPRLHHLFHIQLANMSVCFGLSTGDFWEKMKRFQPALENPRHGPREGWKRIKWALCKKKDVDKFETDLMRHTQSILVLLAVVQRLVFRESYVSMLKLSFTEPHRIST